MGHANYNAQAYGCFILFFVLTTVAIVVRMTSRKIQKAYFWIDDGLVCMSYVTNAAALIVALTETTIGAFDLEKFERFSRGEESSYQKRNLSIAIMYMLTIPTAKLSVLFLYRRVFGMQQLWFKILWWLNVLLIVPCWFGLTMGFLIWGQVDTFSFTNPASTDGAAAVTLLNVVSDILVLVLPIHSVLKLQLSRKRKIGMISFFCLGLVVTLISLTRTTLEFYQVTHGPMHWNAAYDAYNYTVLALAETSTAIICACVLIARPFLVKAGKLATESMSSRSVQSFLRKSRLSSKGSSTNNSSQQPMASEKESEEAITRTFATDIRSIPHDMTESSNESRGPNSFEYTQPGGPRASPDDQV